MLDDDDLLRKTVSDELAEVAKAHGTPRRTVLLESAGQPVRATAAPLEVADDPCRVLLSSTGLLARTSDATRCRRGGERAKHDVVVSAVTTTARGDVGVVTVAPAASSGCRSSTCPRFPARLPAPSLAGGAPISEFLELEQGRARRSPCARWSRRRRARAGHRAGRREAGDHRLPDQPRLLRGHRARATATRSSARSTSSPAPRSWSSSRPTPSCCTSAPTPCGPQGRPAGGMAGVRVTPGERVVFFGAVPARLPTARSSSPSPARRPHCPAPSRARSR